MNGVSFGPLPFIVRYLSYEEFQEATDRDLDRIFPSRPSPASCKLKQASVKFDPLLLQLIVTLPLLKKLELFLLFSDLTLLMIQRLNSQKDLWLILK